jgi:hypothetical protein
MTNFRKSPKTTYPYLGKSMIPPLWFLEKKMGVEKSKPPAHKTPTTSIQNLCTYMMIDLSVLCLPTTIVKSKDVSVLQNFSMAEFVTSPHPKTPYIYIYQYPCPHLPKLL